MKYKKGDIDNFHGIWKNDNYDYGTLTYKNGDFYKGLFEYNRFYSGNFTKINSKIKNE